MQGKSRREWLAETTRQSIIEGAGRAFSAKGYRSATMADIAGEAGLKAPSLYTYFEGKEAILVALGEQFLDEATTTVAEAPIDPPFEEAVRELTRRFTAWMDSRSGVMRFFLNMERSGDPTLAALRAKSTDEDGQTRIDQAFKTYFQRLLASSPDASSHDAERLSLALFGMLDGLVCRWQRDPSARPLSEDADKLVEIFLYGALGGAR